MTKGSYAGDALTTTVLFCSFVSSATEEDQLSV